jgi:hypothetical protein
VGSVCNQLKLRHVPASAVLVLPTPDSRPSPRIYGTASMPARSYPVAGWKGCFRQQFPYGSRAYLLPPNRGVSNQRLSQPCVFARLLTRSAEAKTDSREESDCSTFLSIRVEPEFASNLDVVSSSQSRCKVGADSKLNDPRRNGIPTPLS